MISRLAMYKIRKLVLASIAVIAVFLNVQRDTSAQDTHDHSGLPYIPDEFPHVHVKRTINTDDIVIVTIPKHLEHSTEHEKFEQDLLEWSQGDPEVSVLERILNWIDGVVHRRGEPRDDRA